MMNSSFIDTQQLYQFRHPRTGQVVTYRADDLRVAIGRTFGPVEFIPANPIEFVRKSRHRDGAGEVRPTV
jgi:hypothetical protein